MGAHLSPELRKEHRTRTLPVRKGDQIEVMRGSSKGMRGVVERVSLTKQKVYVEGIIFKKTDGSEVMKALEPSNLKIIKLNLDDERRKKSLKHMAPKKAPAKKDAEKHKHSPQPSEKKSEVTEKHKPIEKPSETPAEKPAAAQHIKK